MKPKKSLGQNFLKSESALRRIIEAGKIKSDDVILEIGPGKGALTAKLIEKAGLVIAVEKDRELFRLLEDKFAKQIKSRSLILVHDDILKFDVNKVLKKNVQAFKIIANIPYNITGAILKKFLATENQPKLMVLMVQNEVAKRIVARDQKESLLSISVKAYGKPKMIMKVAARYFSPKPKVDSAIIAIEGISRKTFKKTGVDEEKFWKIVKLGFAHKRKKLSGNLRGVLYGGNASVDASVDSVNELLANLENKRAEDLTLMDWIHLVSNT